MKISVTGDFWRQVEQARKQNGQDRLPALASLPQAFHDDATAWYVRFRKIGKRRYLFLLHASSGMFFALAGLHRKDLTDPAKLVITWLEKGLLAMGLKKETVASYLHDKECQFFNGGDRTQVAAGNVLFHYTWMSNFDLHRPVRRELALYSLYEQLYHGYFIRDQSYKSVLNELLKTFFSPEDAAGMKIKGDLLTAKTACLANGQPALPVPGITVELELVTNATVFEAPYGDAETKKKLPQVRRVLQVPLDSNLFQLNQAIQASLGLFAYHLYNFLPTVTPDAAKPLLDIYCWEAPPDYPSIYGDLEDLSGQSQIKQIADISVSLREILAMTDYMYYMYDFGDNWAYSIKLGQQLELPGFVCRLADGTGDPPPVDVGGLSGWERFLEAIAQPESKEGQDMLAWSRIVHWTPFDLADIKERLASLNYLGGYYWARKLEPVNLELDD